MLVIYKAVSGAVVDTAVDTGGIGLFLFKITY
jgi:hypothetical protein